MTGVEGLGMRKDQEEDREIEKGRGRTKREGKENVDNDKGDGYHETSGVRR